MQIYSYKLHELLTHNAGLVIFYENEVLVSINNTTKIQKTLKRMIYVKG